MFSFSLLLVGFSFSCYLSTVMEGVKESEGMYLRQRLEMLESQLKSRDIRSIRVLEAMRNVPRHLLVPENVRKHSYSDYPVSIGEGQTISQPYIVALMTQTVDPQPGEVALEIGTGSGYQTAVLAELVKHVYSVEVIPMLAERASKALTELGYRNVSIRQGDGYRGWPENAPFDVIVVTAAAEKIPTPLIAQLAEGGRLMMPVGKVTEVQNLILLTKKQGRIRRRFLTKVRFVPMTGEAQRRKLQ